MVNRIVSLCVVVAALTVPASAHALVFPFYEPPEPLGAVADELVALDFDGDEWPDVAGVSRHTDQVTLVLNGEFGFDDAQTVALPAATAGALAVAGGDLDGDGRDELLVALGDNGSLLVYPGRANGELGAPQEHALRPPAPQQATGVAVADVDGDDDLDVVVAYGTGATVLVNDGRGVLTPSAGALTLPAPRALRLVELAGDDDPDLVVLSANALTVLPGAAAAGFGAPATHDLRFPPAALTTGDVNGDGRLDVGVTYEYLNNYSGEPGLFGGAADGTLTPVTHTALVADALLLADFDGDGVTDRYTGHSPAAFAHGAAGTFGAYNWGVSETSTRERALVAADFDGDGMLDVAGTEAGTAGVSVRYFTGPQLVPSDGNTWFGEVPMGGGRSMIAIAIRNEGGGVARNLELVTEGDTADFEVDVNTCQTAVLRIEQTCWLNVYFKPTALGPRAVDLGMAAEDSGLVWLVTLEGTGLPALPEPPPRTLDTTTHPNLGPGPRPLPPPTPPATAPKVVRPGVPAFSKPTLAGLRRSGLRITQTLATTETVTWTLEHRGTILARTQRKLAGGRVTVTLKLTAAGKRVLAKRKPVSLTLRTKGTLERVTTVRLRRG